MKALLVDDMPRAVQTLAALLNQHCTEVEIVATANNIEDAMEAIQSEQPDVVFLDIDMPDGNGFEMLRKMPSGTDFQLVFVTGHQEYAAEAFDFAPKHFLVKPVRPEKLKEAVDRCKSRESDSLQQIISALQQVNTATTQPYERKRFFTPPNSKTQVLVSIDEIILLEASGAYTDVYTIDGSRYIESRSLKHYENELDTFGCFFRSSDKYLINLNHIESRERRGEGFYLNMTGGRSAQVSVSRVAKFNKIFKR